MLNKFLPAILLLFAVSIFQQTSRAQANPNPCTFPGVQCKNGGGNGLINSFGTKNIVYTATGRSMPFWFAYGDTLTNIIDTSTNAVFAISSVIGSGEMKGHNASKSGKYCYLNDIEFTKAGHYEIRITMSRGVFLNYYLNFEVLPEEDFCSQAPSGKCSNIGGNKIFASGPVGNVITVDAVFPVIVAVIDSVSGNIDSTYSGTIYATKLSGPGMLYGTLSMSGVKWFNFNNLRFSLDGLYTIQFHEQDTTKYKSATLDALVTTNTGLIEIKAEDVFVYPNPFIDQVSLQLIQQNKSVSYQIYDQTGRIVLQKTNENVEDKIIIDTQNLSSGIYLLNIRENSNGAPKKIMIVKQ